MTEIEGLEIFSKYQKDNRHTNVRGLYRTTWVEGTFDVASVEAADTLINHGTSHLGTSFSRRRAYVFFWVMIAALSCLGLRLWYIQIMKGAWYAELAENNSERLIPIAAERGLIFDAQGVQLVKNIPNFSLALVPQDLPRVPEARAAIIDELSTITGSPRDAIEKTISEYANYKNESIVIQEDIPYDTALKIEIAQADLPGVSIIRGSKRLYTTKSSDVISEHNPSAFYSSSTFSFSPVLGYIGKLDQNELKKLYAQGYLPSDTIGKLGLEKSYESYLRGKYGRRRIEVNAHGKEQGVLAEDAPLPGNHIRLTIDAELQTTLEHFMKIKMAAAGKTRAAAIAMDPRTGGIMALVTIPAFDNNDFSGGIDTATYNAYLQNPDHPLFNRAIGGTYPSGSTIKPVIAAAALNEGVITPETTVLSTGGLRVGPWFFPDWQAGGHGVTNVARSLAWSVNTFYYYVGGGFGNFVGLGADKITNYLQRFNFGSVLGIDIPGEQAGFVPSRQWKKEAKGEAWYIGDTYNLAIGQGDLLVTPLQIAESTAVIANGGTLYEPHLVSASINPVTNTSTPFASKIIKDHLIPDQYLAAVRTGMRDCVVYGSCRRLASISFPIAGKTGTAQWNKNKPNHAWFTSYAPADNPQIVLTILVEEGVEGSSISVSIADDFYRWWGTHRHP